VDKDNDIHIELGESVRRHIENKKSPLKDGARATAAYGSPKEDQIPVFVAESVMRAIERHAASQKDKEIGGVLLGGFFRSDEGSFVEVTDSIEAKGAEGTDVSLTFTHETWEQINAEQSRRAPESQIVGWYHSHPALGVFMSKEDEFIHTSFFADPWHVALVVDPTYHNWGCFKWRDGALERTGGFYISGERKAGRRVKEYARNLANARQPAPRSASATADRTDFAAVRRTAALWAVIALLIVSQIVLGYLALGRRSAPPQEPSHLRTAMDLLAASDLTGAAQFLRMELMGHPDNKDAYREMQRLDTVLSEPAIRGLDNDRFDRINLMLAMADRMAHEPPKIKKRSDFEGLNVAPPTGDAGFSPTAAAADPVKNACDVYRSAGSTRQARLQRALLVQKIASALLKSETARRYASGSAWYDRAVKWLREERLREIAYGCQSGQEEYDTLFSKLTAPDRTAVKRLRSQLKTRNS